MTHQGGIDPTEIYLGSPGPWRALAYNTLGRTFCSLCSYRKKCAICQHSETACNIVNFVSSVHSDLIKMTTTAVILVGECIEECKKKTKKCGNSHTAGLKMCNNELVHLYSPQNLLVIAKSAFFQSHKATKDAREYLKVWFVINTCIIQLYTGLFALVLRMQISQSKA